MGTVENTVNVYTCKFMNLDGSPLIDAPGCGRKEGNILFNDAVSTFYL